MNASRSPIVVATVLLICGTGHISASPINASINYSTAGATDRGSETGAPGVSFRGVDNATAETSTLFSLGEFVIDGLSPGSSLTYNNTRFHVKFTSKSVTGDVSSSEPVSMIFNGYLNGTVTNKSSTLTASFLVTYPILDSSGRYWPGYAAKYYTGKYLNTMTLPESVITLGPPGSTGSRTTVQAMIEIDGTPIPEPTALALLGIAVGIFLMRRARA